MLKLELTESLLVAEIGDTAAKMKVLRALGVSFSLDDFGTGHSSLVYLRELPLDQLKIDQSFVRDIVTSDTTAAIIRSTVGLARSLGLANIAQGVETIEQRESLVRCGCYDYQGYLDDIDSGYKSQPLNIALRWRTEKATVFPTELRRTLISHAYSRTACIKALIQH